MDAILKIKASEFSDDLVKKIKSLMPNNDYTITISITDNKEQVDQNRIDEAIRSLANNEGTSFTLESFEDFIRKN